MRAFDIITADGQLRHASPAENPDLYWGLRGGGGNFGVVTSFEFQLHPMDREVIGGMIAFPFSEAKQVLSFYSEYGANAPDELYMDAGLSGDGTPAATSPGSRSATAVRRVRPSESSRRFAVPARRSSTRSSLSTTSRCKNPATPPIRVRWARTRRAGFIAELSPGMIDAVIAGFESHRGRSTGVYFQHGGGAIGRVPADATAFPHRHAAFNALLLIGWPAAADPTEHIAWLREYWAGIESVHARFLYERDRRRGAGDCRRELHGQLQAVAGREEQVRPVEPFPAQRQYRTDRLTASARGAETDVGTVLTLPR